MDKTGKVYLVGAGPGDPGLITQKGLDLLKSCDVVIYDRLASARLLDYVTEDCERIYVGKTVGSPTVKQEEINRIIVEKALASYVVVRLKGGDPFVFGRGGEEALALQERGIPYEVIPGVTSAIAAAAYAGIPVTHRGISRSFHVITGHTAEGEAHIPEDFTRLAGLSGTLVILMGLGNLEQICRELINGGKSVYTPAAVISDGTTIWQKEVRGTLKDICRKAREADIKAPAAVIIGDVAGLDLRTAVRGVLSGIRIGITGTRKITDQLMGYLEELGARTEIAGSSRIAEYKDNAAFETALKALEQYQWIVFTSTNAVTVFFNRMKEMNIDYRRLAYIKFAVVGSGTKKALHEHGFRADLIPKEFTVSQLATELSSLTGDGEKLLIPRAEQGSEALIEILAGNKIVFEDIKIYDIKGYPENLIDGANRFDYLTFASSSGVHGFFRNLSVDPRITLADTKLVCIGEATEAALREYGITDALIAKEASIRGLADRICEDHISI